MQIIKGGDIKKLSLKILIIFSLLLFSSCSSTNYAGVKKLYYPEWWQNQGNAEYVQVYGMATKVSQNSSYDAAYANAMLQAAQYVETYVKGMVKNYEEEAGVDNPQVLALTSKVVRTVAKAKFTNVMVTKQEAIVTDENRFQTFVRVSVPKEAVNKNLMNKIRNEEALYNQFKVSYAFNELDKTIGSVKNNIAYKKTNISNSKSKPAYKKEKIIKQNYPPNLYIERLSFYEPSGNKSLDGKEKGGIKFSINNKGKGNANNIEIKVISLTSNKGLNYNRVKQISTINSNSSKQIEIPISADYGINTQNRRFRIEVLESNGFDADPALISFYTQTVEPPELLIKQIAIDDDKDGDSYGNGDSIIDHNESIEVTAYIQNFGSGIAKNVKAQIQLNTSNQNITCIDENKIIELGNIDAGDYKKVKFYFFTSKRYDETEIPISINITEEYGGFGGNINLNLRMGEKTPNIVELKVEKIDQIKKENVMKNIDDIITRSDVDIDIPSSKRENPNMLAVVFGIENYKYAPDVDFASNDAIIFYNYIKKVFGVPERNIFYRINEDATSGEFNKIFSENGWLSRRITENKTDVIIYYSGHGSPDIESKRGYLIPYDIDPNYANTGICIDDIYSFLSESKAKSFTVFFDACFSGESRSQEMLIAGIRPISVTINNPILSSENISVFSASTGSQYSTSYPEKRHGLFTYFLLKGLKGKAFGIDNKLTLQELHDYIFKNVSNTAGFLDKEQTPTFIGRNRDKILLSK